MSKILGIVGGAGPMAGVDLAKKITQQTKASRDQDHVSFILLSQPESLLDRTEYLLGNIDKNPAEDIAERFLDLERLNATVAAIPCNTAHAPQIFNRVLDILTFRKSKLKVLNLIEETVAHILKTFPELRKVGVLSTTGTQRFHVYENVLRQNGLIPVVPDHELQNRVHAAIYDTSYGIKSTQPNVSNKAVDELRYAMEILKNNGAELIVLGCTELPLAIQEEYFLDMPLIDANLVLARAMIREADSTKLIDIESGKHKIEK